MDGLLGLPVGMQQRFDVIGSEFVDSKGIRHGPRVERLVLNKSCWRQRIIHGQKHDLTIPFSSERQTDIRSKSSRWLKVFASSTIGTDNYELVVRPRCWMVLTVMGRNVYIYTEDRAIGWVKRLTHSQNEISG